MPPIRQPEAKQRDGSSSEDEEEESEENEALEKSDSDSEEEEDKTSTPPAKKPSVPKKPATLNAAAHAQSPLSDESDSDSDSPLRPDPVIKPVASKPMEKEPPKAAATAATKKPRSKISPITAAKRKADTMINVNNQESKREKKKKSVADVVKSTVAEGSSNKKQLFQRLWSEDDEIAILKGMIEYTAKHGADPVADMTAFHDFVKKSLQVEVTKTQLYEKVRRLRKKYENNAGKGKAQGEDPAFSKIHEQAAYELSKKVWGGGNGDNGVGNGSSAKVNGRARKNKKNQSASVDLPKEGEKVVVDEKETMIEVEPNAGGSRSIRFYGSIGGSSLDEEIVKDGLELISDSKKLELEGKWKKLMVEEMELYLKRLDLIREQTKLVLEALK